MSKLEVVVFGARGAGGWKMGISIIMIGYIFG